MFYVFVTGLPGLSLRVPSRPFLFGTVYREVFLKTFPCHSRYTFAGGRHCEMLKQVQHDFL